MSSEREYEAHLDGLDEPMKHGEHVGPTLLRSSGLQVTLGDGVGKGVADALEDGHDEIVERLALDVERDGGIVNANDELEHGDELTAGGGHEGLLVGAGDVVVRREELDNVGGVAFAILQAAVVARVLLERGEGGRC